MRIIFLILISIQTLSLLKAQDEAYIEEGLEEEIIDDYYMANKFETYFGLSFPTAAYKRQNMEVGYGFGFKYLRKIFSENNLYYGLNFDIYTFHSRSVTYIEPDPLGDYEVRQRTFIRSSNLNPIIRFETQFFENFKPYLEANAGVKFLITKSTLTDVELDDVLETWREQDDTVLSYGATVGFEYQFKRSPNFGLSFSVSYQSTTSGTYHVENGNYEVQDPYWPVEYFELKNSTTDVINSTLGVNLYF